MGADSCRRFTHALALAATLLAIQAKPAISAPAQAGETVYLTKGCHLCHGTAGQGALLTGPRLGPQPLPLPAFQAAIRQPRNEMPAYAPSVLSDGDIAEIHHYLQSLPAPADPATLGVFPEP